MGTCEALHQRFVNTSTSGLTLLDILVPSLQDDPEKLNLTVIEMYHKRVLDKTADGRLHDAVRTFLCHQYQLRVDKKIKATAQYSIETLEDNLRRLLFNSDENDAATQSMLNDVAILQMILYQSSHSTEKLWSEALDFVQKQIDKDNNYQHYFSIIEVLSDAVGLRGILIEDTQIFCPSELVEVIQSWYAMIDENNSQEWRPFVSVLLKLMRTMTPSIIVSRVIWCCIKNYSGHTDTKSLALLSALIDDLLSGKSTDILELNMNSSLSGKVSRLIFDKLASPIQLHRKQSQYVLRRIVDYLGGHLQDGSEWRDQNNETEEHRQLPFVFYKADVINVEEIKSNYFSLLEILEEKQAHLVLPAMIHLDELLEASITHKSLLDTAWVRCIFARVLHHDCKSVIKAGLGALLRVDLQIFDDGFMKLLMETLSKTFLYEDQSSDPHPQVLKDLSELFIKAEQTGINFTSKFIISASTINWSPIPLVYLFEALGNNKGMTEVNANVWAGEELEALRVITEKHVKRLIKIMRLPTEINILNCITIYVKPPLDFLSLGRLFESIASDGVLARGNDSWRLITNYLKKNTEESAAVKSVSECLELMKNGADLVDTKALVILIVLMCDTGNRLFEAAITSNCLYPLLVPIVDAYKRPYADTSQFLLALQTIIYLMELSPQEDDAYIPSIFGFSNSIFDLVMSRLRSNWPNSYEIFSVHVKALSAVLKIPVVCPSFEENINSMINIGDDEIQKITALIYHSDTPVIRSWYALNILYLLKSSRACDAIFNQAPPKFVSTDGDGKIVSECYGLVGKIYYYSLCQKEVLTEEILKGFLTEKLVILADHQSDHAVPVIATTLLLIIKKLWLLEEITDECFGIIGNIIDSCWKNFWDMSKTEEYWESAEQLIGLTLDEAFLREDTFRQMAVKYVDTVISRTDNCSALRLLLFFRMNSAKVQDILPFCDAMLLSFLQTDVGKINKRLEMQTCCYIMKNHEIDFLDDKVKLGLGVYSDMIIRALLVKLMMRPHDEDNIYTPQLLSKLEELRNKRYFGDSNTHRLKLRIMQVLLSTWGTMSYDDTLSIHDALTQSILSETDQPSVRIMKEWTLVMIYNDIESFRKLLWNSFPLARENRPGSLVSLVSIVYHVAKCLPPAERLEYIRQSVTHILPGCFCQQFIARLYSQVIMSKLLEMMNEISPEQFNEFRSVREAVQESLRFGNSLTNSVKLLDNFYFSVFNAEEDWHIRNIFHEIPRLTNVCMDEWIRPEVFVALKDQEHGLPVSERFFTSRLSACETPGAVREPETPDADVLESEDILTDIQKKITPTSGLSTGDSVTRLTAREKLVTSDTGLVVIASLVEGFPNLGGLARTAEIFCARELVLKSKRYTENKDFQSLSVTADKWITISEVKPHELRDYLLEKKSRGWNLVGAEQTVNSVNLLDMKFSEKTILLLGNEKTGIPANLIQLLDTCVEIPQAGIVRSLNVHVTGAICMWQYAQQHIF